ncbi:MAG: glycosyltransferase family 2 protein [Lachnospiraceae bacterium]|nr:glycosyltransferase family 2 protein [Lachnospiraceae bacterium]
MGERPFFTIIIPCYNAEKTLAEAVGSVTEQSFSDLEVVIVDDGSRDWSFVLAHSLGDADPRVRVIALADNNGPAEARNKGIMEARGEYVLFLDADDIYSDGLLEKVREAAESRPDVIIWGDREEYLDDDGEIRGFRDITMDSRSYTDQKLLRSCIMDLEEKSLYGYLWNKAYRSDAIKGIRIPDQAFNEDEMFNIAFFNEVKTAKILNLAGTHYRRGRVTLTHRELVDYYPLAMKRIAGLMQQHKLWSLYTDDVHTRLANLYLRYILSTLERLYRPAMAYGQKSRLLFMQRVFSSRLCREMVPYMKPDNIALKRLAVYMKRRNAAGCLRIGRLTHALKKRMPVLFDRMK